MRLSFSNNFVFKLFLYTLRRKAGAFQSSSLNRVFGKLPFRYGLGWTVGLNVKTKLCECCLKVPHREGTRVLKK